MHKVISINVTLPNTPTNDFRNALREFIANTLDTQVNDIWDGEDTRPENEEVSLMRSVPSPLTRGYLDPAGDQARGD